MICGDEHCLREGATLLAKGMRQHRIHSYSRLNLGIYAGGESKSRQTLNKGWLAGVTWVRRQHWHRVGTVRDRSRSAG